MAAIITYRGLFLWSEDLTETHSGMLSRTLHYLNGNPEGSQDGRIERVALQVIATSVFVGLSSHCLATGLTTQTTRAVDANEQGALLGLEHGLFSLARVVGPPLGTILFTMKNSGFLGVALACSTVDLSLWALLAMAGSTKAASPLQVQESKSQ